MASHLADARHGCRLEIAPVARPAGDLGVRVKELLIDAGDPSNHFTRDLLLGFVIIVPLIGKMAVGTIHSYNNGENGHGPGHSLRRHVVKNVDVLKGVLRGAVLVRAWGHRVAQLLPLLGHRRYYT